MNSRTWSKPGPNLVLWTTLTGTLELGPPTPPPVGGVGPRPTSRSETRPGRFSEGGLVLGTKFRQTYLRRAA